MLASGHDNTNFYFNPSTSWAIGPTDGTPQPLTTNAFQIIDLNGDGLADVVFGTSDSNSGNQATFVYQINGGPGGLYGFGTAECVLVDAAGNGCVTTAAGAAQLQVGDYDGDGKGDVWIPQGSGNNAYDIYEYTGAGFSATPIASPLYASDISATPERFTFQVDMDGDGFPDTFMFDQGGAIGQQCV